MKNFSRQPNQWARRLYFGTLGAVLLLLCVSGWYVLRYWRESRAAADRYGELAAIVESVRATEDCLPEATAATQPGILPEYAALFQENSHLAGWIRIDGTCIDYPVMQTPDSRDYYLRRDFDGSYSTHGCIYANEACDLTAPSDNVTLYGHFMKDGSMFADLESYLDPDFRDSYPYVRFDCLTQRRTYEVFAVFKTTASIGQGFEYHNFIHAASREDFDWFIGRCKALALYDTGITPVYGDKILCLSTCEYSVPNGRLVVAAVLTEESHIPTS